MKISAIIPTFNKIERLRLALSSYEGQNCDKNDFEIIVVADKSDTGITEQLKCFEQSLNLKIVIDPKRGFPGARNYGAKYASGEYLGFFDDDILICPEYIEHCLSQLQQKNDVVVRAPVYTLYSLKFFKDPEKGIPYPEFEERLAKSTEFSDRLISSDMIKNHWWRIKKQCNKLNRFERIVKSCLEYHDGKQVLPWMGVSGSGVVLHRDCFWSVNGYDEELGKFWGAESIDLGYRLHQKGTTFVNLPHIYSAHIDHPRNESMSKFHDSFGYVFRKFQDNNLKLISELILGTEEIHSSLARVEI